MRWKLECDELLSGFAFNFNLRRYGVVFDSVNGGSLSDSIINTGNKEDAVVIKSGEVGTPT